MAGLLNLLGAGNVPAATQVGVTCEFCYPFFYLSIHACALPDGSSSLLLDAGD